MHFSTGVYKTEQQTYRLSEEDKIALAKVADDIGIPAASLVGTLASRFVKAREELGSRLIWPPEFNYYPAGSKSIQEDANKSDLANESSVKKAG